MNLHPLNSSLAAVVVPLRDSCSEGQDFTARGSAQGAQVSAANARTGLPIPLHISAGKTLESMVK